MMMMTTDGEGCRWGSVEEGGEIRSGQVWYL
jgi:hypothetical protein